MALPLIPFLVGAAAGAAVTYWLRKPAAKEPVQVQTAPAPAPASDPPVETEKPAGD